MNSKAIRLRRAGFAAALSLPSALVPGAALADPERFGVVVEDIVRPLMEAHDIPGVAVGLIVDGQSRIFNFGLASSQDERPVDDRTLFEIGSLSKPFTGTLGAYVAAKGRLSLDQRATTDLPELAGTLFDDVSLLDLATYTAGGLPLQFPDEVTDEASMMDFYRTFRPAQPPGEARLYSNPSIGLFGYAAARAEGVAFETLMEETLLPALGLGQTFLTVPDDEMANYAFGVSRDDRPIRVTPGVLDAQAYGIKTTASDLLRFVELSMDPASLEAPVRDAVLASQTGYLRFGQTLQGLGWEIYDAPQSLDVLLAGNSPSMALEPQAVETLDPPQAPKADRLVNKTGATAGFGAYAAFLPERGIGIVILANRNYPNAERVEAAWSILTAIE